MGLPRNMLYIYGPLLLCWSFMLGTISADNCNCSSAESAPICASNGITYANLCLLQCHTTHNPGLHVVHAGACLCPNELCPQNYAPVCDSHGRTHPNECVFTFNACIAEKVHHTILTIVAYTACNGSETTVAESSLGNDAAPVRKNVNAESRVPRKPWNSASDGARNRSSAVFRILGPRACLANCSRDYTPVCASNGNTYPNKCIMEYANCLSVKDGHGEIRFSFDGICAATTVAAQRISSSVTVAVDSPSAAARTVGPSEATSKKSVSTQSTPVDTTAPQLRVFGATTAKLVAAVPTAPPGADDCETPCTKIYQPVCTLDNQTIQSRCIFDQQNCIRRKAGKAAMQVFHDGPCTIDQSAVIESPESAAGGGPTVAARRPDISTCERHCPPSISDPLCDTDGGQHPSKCLFAQMSCISETLKGTKLEIAHLGPCRRPPGRAAIVIASPTVDAPPREEEWQDRLESIETIGESCRINCPVDFQDDPVCDTAGKTYPHICIFTYEICLMRNKTGESSLKLAHKGACTSSAGAPSASVFESSPQHGVVRSGADLTSCPPPICTKNFAPVCASNNVTYGNPCLFEHARCVHREVNGTELTLLFRAPCDVQRNNPGSETTVEPPKAIKSDANSSACQSSACNGNEYFPICATNGQTYSNLCLYNKARCDFLQANQSELVIASFGRCEGENFPNFNTTDCSKLARCLKIWQPVCDNRGTTHGNLCEFSHFSCLERVRTGLGLAVAYVGECRTEEEEACKTTCEESLEHSPAREALCNTYGESYSNLCLFNLQNCRIVKNASNHLDVAMYVAHFGACAPRSTNYPLLHEQIRTCEIVCSNEYDPVCGNDGKTYANLCLFNYDACLARKISQKLMIITHRGPCRQAPTVPVVTNALTTKFESTNQLLTLAIPTLPGPTDVSRAENDSSSCSAVCPFEESIPLCDSENVTHSNYCNFAMANCTRRRDGEPTLTILHLGECGSLGSTTPAAATTLLQTLPPPSPDGVRYHSRSGDAEANVTILHTSSGGTPKCVANCQKNYAPLCDSNGKTHSNNCTFQYSSCVSLHAFGKALTILHDGECERTTSAAVSPSTPTVVVNESTSASPVGPASTTQAVECSPTCTREYKPVCDVRNQTYPNLCVFRYAACLRRRDTGEELTLAHDGHCQAETATVSLNSTACVEEPCLKVWQPVCDSKGVTHESECAFRNYKCAMEQKNGETISIAHLGQCVAAECNLACSTNDTLRVQPVCDANFVTHPSMCALKRAQCEERRSKGTSVEFLFTGACSDCVRDCTNVYAPVCNNVGRTHSNRCEFSIAKCIYERRFNQNLTVLHEGECCQRNCTAASTQAIGVCDSKGKTHDNFCEFSFAKCIAERSLNETLFIVNQGPCSQTTPAPSPSDLFPVIRVPDEKRKPSDPWPFTPLRNSSNSSSSCSRSCTNISEPLCASDSKTYANRCFFEQAACFDGNLTVVSHGACSDEKSCSREYEPLCDMNGETHPNRCIFEKARQTTPSLQIDYAGECCNMHCPKYSSPVCDSEGKSHMNLCGFETRRCIAARKENQTVELAHFGLCRTNGPCRKPCPNVYDPVCGSDNRTYTNDCELSTASCVASQHSEHIDLLYRGECCKKSCTFDYAPVCDSNGRTHANPCVFELHKCELERMGTSKNASEELPRASLEIVHEGPCETVCKPESCTLELNPICDNRGTTHANACSFRAAQCEARKAGRPELVVAYSGECSSCKMRLCPQLVDPVCDTNGRTHSSDCDFANYVCGFSRGLNGTNVTIDYKGDCCEKPCTRENKPVCDQHATSYSNRCLFEIVACKRSRKNGETLLAVPCSAARSARTWRRV